MKKTLLFQCCFLVVFLPILFSSSFDIAHYLPPAPGPGGVGTTDGTSNLKLWLKADVGVTTSSDLVTDWQDQSGYGNHVDQNNQNKRPLLQPTGLNGAATLYFNGEGAGSHDHFLDNSSSNLATSGSSRTIFIVGRMNKCEGTGGTLLESRRSATVFRSMVSSNGSEILVYSDGNDANNDGSIPLSSLGEAQKSFIYTQASDGASNKITVRLNGVAQTVTQPGIVTSESGSNGFIIGLDEDNSLPWSGQISEIIVFDKALDAQEILDIEAYLSAKYPASPTQLTGTSPIPATEPGSGYALSFDGINDRVIAGDDFDMGTNNFTLEAWVYTQAGSFTADPGDLGKRIISKGATDHLVPSGAGYGLELYLDGADNAALFFIGDNTNSLGVQAIGLEEDKWYHIACVRDGMDVRIYINGILGGTNSFASVLDVDNNDYFSIGCLTREPTPGPDPAYAEHFKGKLDEIRVWRMALSETQIRNNMCSKLTDDHTQACNLAAYYRLDNGSGALATDLVTKANANISGATWELSAAPIGDVSDWDYTNIPKTVFFSNPKIITENILAQITTGAAAGLHTYYVGEVPNSITGATGIGNNDHYFGVHVVNGIAATYSVGYTYDGNPYVNASNEATLILLKRDNNADLDWENTMATLNTVDDLLVASGQSTEYVLGSSGVALPVELKNLTAQPIDKHFIKISWQTALEANNKGFEIQRSQNARDFHSIGWLDGRGNSFTTQNYQFNDQEVETGIRYFYRLKQVDFDAGQLTEFSSIVSAIIEGDKFEGQISPNPLNEELNIYFSNTDKYQNTSLHIYDLSGKECWHKGFIQLPEKLRQPLDFLPGGLYFVTLQSKEGQIVWSDRIVKK